MDMSPNHILTLMSHENDLNIKFVLSASNEIIQIVEYVYLDKLLKKHHCEWLWSPFKVDKL